MEIDDELNFAIAGKRDSGIVGFFKPDPCSQYFQGHFPGYPIVPGVLLLEISMRILTRALEMPRANLIVSSFTKISFLKPIFPNDNVEIEVAIDGCEAKCIGFIHGETVFKFIGCFKSV